MLQHLYSGSIWCSLSLLKEKLSQNVFILVQIMCVIVVEEAKISEHSHTGEDPLNFDYLELGQRKWEDYYGDECYLCKIVQSFLYSLDSKLMESIPDLMDCQYYACKHYVRSQIKESCAIFMYNVINDSMMPFAISPGDGNKSQCRRNWTVNHSRYQYYCQ
jgi:hypothetical protein